MRPIVCVFAFTVLLVAGSARAGSISAGYYNLLDPRFNPGLPGRVTISFDQSGTAFTDLGVNAFSEPDLGLITSVAQVDINQADPNLVGIGLARTTFDGLSDSSFQTSGKRVKDAYMTSVVDACVDPNGRIVVAGMTPGANGSSGAKDLALVRFNADGSDDLTFGGDGGIAFSFLAESGGVENDEGIRDVDCLANGNILIGGWYNTGGDDRGSVIEMAANGSTSPLRIYTMAGGEGTDAVASFVEEIDAGIMVGFQFSGASNYARFTPLTPSGGAYVATLGRDAQSFGTGWSNCGGILEPQFFGMAQLATGDYVLSGLRDDGGVNVPILARIQYGESVLVSCVDINNGVNNAYVTPPAVIGDLVFVAAGLQPFGSGPLSSRIKAFVAPANGSAPVPAPGYGTNGMVEWSYPYSVANSNNNRSFVQRLYFDPAYGLMAVGTRTWNGNDTDVALARFGSTGVIFGNGFEAD